MSVSPKNRSKSASKKRYRRTWWKRLIYRRPTEDRVEYTSRLIGIPVILISLVLLNGFRYNPEDRADYLDNLTESISTAVGKLVGNDSTRTSNADGISNPLSIRPSPGLSSEAQREAMTDEDSSVAGADSLTRTPVTIPPEGLRYIVKSGEWLVDISRAFYGTASQWRRLWLYNVEKLPKPDDIRAGLELVIPPPGELTEAEEARIRLLLGESS